MPPINTGDRKELGKLLQSLAAGDQVLATRIDRLARSMFELFAIVKKSSTFNRLTRLLEISANPVEFRPKENDLLLQCRDFKCEPTVDFLFVF